MRLDRPKTCSEKIYKKIRYFKIIVSSIPLPLPFTIDRAEIEIIALVEIIFKVHALDFRFNCCTFIQMISLSSLEHIQKHTIPSSILAG